VGDRHSSAVGVGMSVGESVVAGTVSPVAASKDLRGKGVCVSVCSVCMAWPRDGLGYLSFFFPVILSFPRPLEPRGSVLLGGQRSTVAMPICCSFLFSSFDVLTCWRRKRQGSL
jgi:hypothetical protein